MLKEFSAYSGSWTQFFTLGHPVLLRRIWEDWGGQVLSPCASASRQWCLMLVTGSFWQHSPSERRRAKIQGLRTAGAGRIAGREAGWACSQTALLSEWQRSGILCRANEPSPHTTKTRREAKIIEFSFFFWWFLFHVLPCGVMNAWNVPAVYCINSATYTHAVSVCWTVQQWELACVELCDAMERPPTAHKSALDYCQTRAYPVLYVCRRKVGEWSQDSRSWALKINDTCIVCSSLSGQKLLATWLNVKFRINDWKIMTFVAYVVPRTKKDC